MKYNTKKTLVILGRYTKLALAHHLDDLAESFVMSALHNGQASGQEVLLFLLHMHTTLVGREVDLFLNTYVTV